MGVIGIDLDKAKDSAKKLKANPPSETDAMNDPKAFLAKFGVTIDSKLSKELRSKLASVKDGGAQASAIHIDL